MPDVSNDSPEFEPLVVEDTPPDDGADRPPRYPLTIRAAFAVGAALVVAVAAVVAAAAEDDESAIDSEGLAGATVDTVDSAPSLLPPVTLAPVSTAYPVGWSSVDVSDRAVDPVGVADGWVDWSIPLPTPLDGVTLPVEVVTLTAGGMLHRIELPEGLVRTRLLPALSTEGQIAVTDDAIAVPQPGGLVIARDDGALVTVALPTDRAPRVSRLGSRFVATVDEEAGGVEQWWIIESDGSVTDVSDGPLGGFTGWDVRFLPSGEPLANDGDGIYSVDVDGAGGVVQVDEGRLIAVGPGRYIVRTCDDAADGPNAACRYAVVDRSTGRRTFAPLGVLDAYRFWDTSIRVSPDGRFVQYADWQRQRPRSRVVDLADGAVLDVGPLGDVRTPDAWAPDGSGVFVPGDDGVVFRSVDGRAAVIDGLGSLRSVATRAEG